MNQSTTVSPSVLRLIWKSVLEFNYQILLSLPDRDLSEAIAQKVKERIVLAPDEAQRLDDYVASKLLLIRDLAIVN
ncbi:hypothetical protein [Chamaesiphon minutus]|uniref:Uncharacterized protein n=1 Tax=Chamaesiphon minutus (strain ATCC 27169 / PCC 6605) TaxID=1173020 RepID=K9UP58_CHAP6|nr:hypothetical protein [Chamaesiphon minutus]AFY95979.1 hypothetical protein Cha6605_5078 [Chamaesiphon minutus PCC 6605]